MDALETEILQAMLGHANPLFMVGLLVMNEKEPDTIYEALLLASKTYYLTLEQQFNNRRGNKHDRKSHDNRDR
jgi:hypothetical protein